MSENEKTGEKLPEAAQLGEADIRRLQDDLPNDEVLYDLAELFRVFGDSTRIKILYALFESELCVNDIAQVVGISQSAVSHQLRVLKTSKLVKFRREGKAMYYSLDDDHVRSMIDPRGTRRGAFPVPPGSCRVSAAACADALCGSCACAAGAARAACTGGNLHAGGLAQQVHPPGPPRRGGERPYRGDHPGHGGLCQKPSVRAVALRHDRHDRSVVLSAFY